MGNVINTIVESLDNVPTELHEFYTETDGKFIANLDEDVKTHPRVAALSNAYRKEQDRRKELATKVQEFETKLSEIPEGFDAEEYLALKASANTDPAKKKEAADEHLQSQRALYDKRIADMQKKFEADLAAKDEALAERDGYIDRSVGDTRLREALREVGVAEDYEDGAFSLLRPSVKVQRAETGDRTPIVETDMGELDVAKFVKDWAHSKGKPYLRKETGPDARGGNAHSVRGKTISRKEFDALDPMAKHKAMTVDKLQVVAD